MKGYAQVFLLLTLVLVLEAKVEDFSIIKELNECGSELRAKVRGDGVAATVTEARRRCKESCKEGVAEFKKTRCPQLCGMTFVSLDGVRFQKCSLCYNDKEGNIEKCRTSMDLGLENCIAGCDVAEFATVGVDYAVKKYLRTHQTSVPQ